MKRFFKFFSVFAVILSMGLAGCSEDNGDGSGSSKPGGSYGTLGGNLITIGSTKDITYTSCVLLGTVDFPKITSDHTYGIVVMEALKNPDFDYDSKLIYGGHSEKTDKEDYVCGAEQINSSAKDGKFEKQLIGLKPNTRYYYRAYVRIGQNVNYSSVEYFTTQDPSPEITLGTYDAENVFAVSATFKGACAVGKLLEVNEDQSYGFIYTTASQMSTADKLTYEYYEEWKRNHFETDEIFDAPEEITADKNLDGRINCVLQHAKPGTTYYYRTFFEWNGKYFYSSEVKSVTTKGTDEITVGTGITEDITSSSATLHATVPFSLIGLDEIEGGFMISKKYSNASEFNMDVAEEWEERYIKPNANIYYVELDEVDNKDFSYEIDGLDPETTYYVCAYVCLGEYDDEDLYIYGPVQSFTTGKRGEDDPDDDVEGIGNLNIYSEGNYPWTQIDDVWVSGNSGIDNSSSVLTIEVSHNAGDLLTFDLMVSSERGYDQAIVRVNGQEYDRISGNNYRNFTHPFSTTGKSVVQVEYQKDGSGSDGNDCATVSNIQLNRTR